MARFKFKNESSFRKRAKASVRGAEKSRKRKVIKQGQKFARRFGIPISGGVASTRAALRAFRATEVAKGRQAFQAATLLGIRGKRASKGAPSIFKSLRKISRRKR